PGVNTKGTKDSEGHRDKKNRVFVPSLFSLRELRVNPGEAPASTLSARVRVPRRLQDRLGMALLHFAVAAAIEEIDAKPEGQPDEENYPSEAVQRNHHQQRDGHSHNGHKRHPRGAEGPVQLRLAAAQNPDAGADHGEGKEG